MGKERQRRGSHALWLWLHFSVLLITSMLWSWVALCWSREKTQQNPRSMPAPASHTFSQWSPATRLSHGLTTPHRWGQLQFRNYGTILQVIGKSCKPIPVMVLGVLVGRKKYPALKYLFILMIVAGVALFMYKDSAAQKSGSSDSLIGIGELLLLVSLTCDGLTGAVQERMKAEHGTKSGHMMLAMNKWSIGYLLVALLITGEGFQFISFLQRHPSVLWELASFSVASALGQFFIFMTVSDFGPLPCSIITTTRSLLLLYLQVVYDYYQEILHCFGLCHLLW